MTVSAIGSNVATIVHHRAGRTQPAAAAGTTTAAASGGSSNDATPLQKFSGELQSILLQAQSGQKSASATTADNPATSADPASASDPTSTGLGSVAARLQKLIGGDTGSGDSKSDVLNRLQQTLQQALKQYAAA